AEEVLIKPLVTEKSTKLTENLNRFTFVVDKNANKLQIKEAIETMYGVTVDRVWTMIMPAKEKVRFTKQGIARGRKISFKKAIVSLVEGDTIDFYSNI
ncbi:MAG: 50S ribosomal protein L23, partial [Chitinophagales bacterium]